MQESLLLGIIQGITEWLPVSSEGMLVLAQMIISGDAPSLIDAIRFALFLHLGTFFAALVYFRKEVVYLIRQLFSYQKAEEGTQALIRFYVIATVISGIVGFALVQLIAGLEEQVTFTSTVVMLVVGVLLLVTAAAQLWRRGERVTRRDAEAKRGDALFLGLVQGCTILPGLSRSGLTVAALLVRRFRDEDALKMSFLLSLPAVLGGNIALNLGALALTLETGIALLAAFLFGLATIHILLHIAHRISFGWFVLGFGILTIAAAFL